MKTLKHIAFIIIFCPFLSVFAAFNNTDSSIILKGGVGYGYSFYGIAEGSSFNINPGSGLDVDMALMIKYKFLALDTNILFSTINDTHFGADAKQFRTEGGGKLVMVDPRIGYYKAMNRYKLDYLFIYGGMRIWNADYAYSKIGSMEYASDDSMSGLGFTVGGRYVTTFSSFIDEWPFAFFVGAYFSYAPLSSLERDSKTLEISDQTSFTPGFEIGIGFAQNSYGLAFFINSRYDVISTKYKESETGFQNLSKNAGSGTLKILFSIVKNIPLDDF